MSPPAPEGPASPDPASADAASGRRPSGPSVLDLVRLSPKAVFPPGGEALYRQIALLTDLQEGQTVLDSGSGRGISTSFLAATYGVEAHGLEPDAALVTRAEQSARASGLDDRLHFQCAPLDDLPYRDGIFDVAIGEVGFAVNGDPTRMVRELARVTKPYGKVVLVQLVWSGNLAHTRREELVENLGARPMLLVEWKQMLRDAGVVDLHVEDWTESASPFRQGRSASALEDLASIFSFWQKMTIFSRALRRWGWRGARLALRREREIHELLTRERVLGLSLIIGSRWVTDRIEPSPRTQ